jgi:predicted DNA-binding antitoxin AbrB/MazE fold protein
MVTISATWKNGCVVPDGPVDWPEGCRLRIQPAFVEELTGMTEEEQGDDPESIRRWIEEFDAIPPLPMSPEEEAELIVWRAKVKAYNLEAVRRQVKEGFQ